MPLTVRNSARRRRKNPDDKLRPGESSSAQVMAPTRMKLRVRRHDNATGVADAVAGGGQPEEEEEEEEERSRERGGHSSRRKNTNNTPTTAAATSSSSPPSSSSASASARAVMAAEEASPDSKCPICLDRFNNLAYLDRCLHRFCFPCIQEWSHNKAECPLCKQPFASILHSVRAEDDFKEYTLRPAPPNSSVAATVAMVAAMASAARSDHQMRLMLRRHRGTDNGETTTRRRRRERGGRRVGVWEWYLDSPPVALPPLPHHPAITPVVAEDSEEVEGREEQRVRRGADLAERGVIFEGLSGLGGAVAPVAPNDRASRRLMTRLVARQRLQRDGGTVRRLRDRETVAFRRALYRSDIRVRGVSGVNGNSNQEQQQRDITAESFRRNPVHLNRLRPWLRRELTVLYGAHGSLVDIVQRIIMARLARHGLEDTPTIEEELRPFLLARTDHFLHELVSFARSPLSLENYDLQAVYEPPAAALELEVTSSSTDSSSVIAISEGEEEERLVGGAHDDVIQTGSCLSLSAWDDETPGPSYSTAEPSCSLASLSFSPAPQEAANEEEGEEREEECLIVGYKKPIAERTPELVQLSSDTEEEEEEKKKGEENIAEEFPPIPSTTSCLPTIPPSTSGACRGEQDEKSKDVDEEVDRRRSWSGSSGRSGKSACSPSQAPGEAESCRDRKQSDSEAARETRRRKRSRGGRERSGDRLRKSGTLYNPNRSIYPAMMRHRSRSPSPLHSSVESGSPLAPSPPDSSWEYHGSQGSPLTSPVCSSSSSSSPLCSSPLPSSQTPPTPSLSPSDRTHHREKPGGKRKYKSRHLDSNDKDPTWRPSSSHGREKRRERRRGRDGGRRRERQRRDAPRERGGDSTKRCREDRSPSVEIIYEGTVTSNQPPACKRRRKRHRKTQHSSSPVIITLDSDSSHDDVNNKNCSSSSSPISSQQTVDFSDLPPLPLVHSAGVGGPLSAEFGELPVDILDRGSDGSETDPTGPVAVDNSDNSDHDVDVENVDESVPLLGSGADGGPVREADSKATTSVGRSEARTGARSAAPTTTSEVWTSDSRLLAAVLSDLKGITAAKCDTGCSSSTRTKRSADQREGREAQSNQDRRPAETRRPSPDWLEERRSNDVRDQTQGFDFPALRTSTPPLPPVELLKECRVTEESRDVPPLLKQASPVRSYNRNTPPPLKHKDAGSPHLLLVSPFDLHSAHAESDVELSSGSPINSSLSDELPKDKKHFAKAPSEVGGSTVRNHSMSHRSPPDSLSSSGYENRSTDSEYSPHLDFKSFNPSKLLSSCDNTKGLFSGPRSLHTDLHPVNSLFPVDVHSAETGRSREKPAQAESTSRGCRVTADDLHPASRVSAEGTTAGSEVSSGASCENSAPVCVSSIDSRTLSSFSTIDSHCSSQRENLPARLSPSRGGSVPQTAHSDRLSPVDVQPGSPRSASASVSHEEASPLGRLPPVDLHCRPAPPAHVQSVNHAALFSSAFQTALRTCSSQSHHTSESHPERLRPPDEKPGSLVHPSSSPQPPPCSTHDLCAGSQRKARPPVDPHPKDVQPPSDNHVAPPPQSVDNQWKSNSSTDERSARSAWNTHTHSAT